MVPPAMRRSYRKATRARCCGSVTQQSSKRGAGADGLFVPYFAQSRRGPLIGRYVQSVARNEWYAAVQASMLQRTCGSASTPGAAACVAVPGAGARATGAARPGGTIGAPIVALGVSDGGCTTTGVGAGAACNPASVSTIGDIGAERQSSPSNTLPSAITITKP